MLLSSDTILKVVPLFSTVGEEFLTKECSLVEQKFTELEVLHVLENLQNSRAAGSDEVRN